MSCMFGLGPRPEQERVHNFRGQVDLGLEKPWTEDEPVR